MLPTTLSLSCLFSLSALVSITSLLQSDSLALVMDERKQAGGGGCSRGTRGTKEGIQANHQKEALGEEKKDP